MAIGTPNFSRSSIDSPTADFAKTLSAFGTNMMAQAKQDEELKLQRERQAAQDARQARMDLLATPGTAEYASAQKAKWELEQQNPEVVAQNEFRKVRANVMGPVAMNNELIDAVGKYAGNVDISKMTPEEQAVHWKKLETVGNSLQDSVQQPTTAQAYGYMGQSPLMANNKYYQDEMAAKLTAEEMAQATRISDAYKAKQSLAEKMLDAQAKYANKNGGSITLEDGTTINTGGSGSSKGTSIYDAGKDLEKYENSLYKRIEDLSKSNEDSQYNDPKKVRKLVEDAIAKGASPEQLIFDKDKEYISLPEIGNYVEKVVTPQGTRAPFNTSAYDEMMAQQNAIIEAGGNLKPAAKTYDNRKILAMLNGEEFIDDTSPAAISSYVKDPALSKVFDDAGIDSKKVGSYLTKAYKAEGGQGDDTGKYKGLGQFAEDTAEPYLKALGKTWADYRKDEGLQRTVMEQFTADNYKKLVRANIEPTEFNLYLMHNQGEGGANAYLSDKPLDQMQSYRLLNQLSNEQIGVDLPRHKRGTAAGQIDINEVQRQGIDLTKIDARGLYGDKFEKKFDNSKEDLISRLGNLGQAKNGSVPKQSVAELFSKVDETKLSSTADKVIKEYETSKNKLEADVNEHGATIWVKDSKAEDGRYAKIVGKSDSMFTNSYSSRDMATLANTLRKDGFTTIEEITKLVNSMPEGKDKQLVQSYLDLKNGKIRTNSVLERLVKDNSNDVNTGNTIKSNPDVVREYRKILNEMARKEGYIGTSAMPNYPIEQFIKDMKIQ